MRRTSFIRNLFTTLLLVLGFSQSSRLWAQLDPRLQTTASDSDVLDVYKSAGAKPEMLTIFDFSGSMHAVYWDPRYFTNKNQTSHADQWGLGALGDFPGIVPVIDDHGNIYMVQGTGYFNNINTDGSGNAILPAGITNDGSAQLVKPDGTLLSTAIAGTYTQTQLTAFVKQASHVRVTATTTTGANTVARTIDLPLPWVILDPAKNSNANSTITFVTDPKLGPSIEPDRVYLDNTQNNIVNDVNSLPFPSGGSAKNLYKIGRFHYNVDFLWWVFFGKDTRNSTNNGSNLGTQFVIPAVLTRVNSVATTGQEPVAPTQAQMDLYCSGFSVGSDYPKVWTNGLVGYSRFMALKNAVVRSWFANQDAVWWGYRYLDNAEEGVSTVSSINGNAASTAISRDIRLFRTAQNSSSVDTQLKKFLALAPATSTPLTYAFANGYTQLSLNKDPSSSFGTSSGGGQSGTESPIPACRKSFMVVFTDGIANDGLSSSGAGDAIGTGTDIYGLNTDTPTANAAMDLNSLVPGTSGRFNIWTLAAVAAHYVPSAAYASPTSAGSYPVPIAAPFNISDRGATIGNKRHIRTMTVAMSVAGSTLEPGSGKSDLFRAALYGNPEVDSWDLNTKPFDSSPGSTDNDSRVNPFFFDATSVNSLVTAMNTIIAEVAAASASISAPSSPLVGLNLGSQAYLGIFKTATRGPVWQGDLLMAGIKANSSGVSFLGKDGLPITSITADTANWSAATMLQTSPHYWDKRNIYTAMPGSNTLIRFDETTITTPSTLGAPDAATLKQWIRWIRGANTSDVANLAAMGSFTSTGNRPDVMGDIINSSPITLEYPLSLASAFLLTNTSTWTNKHFRVIFVGDNQGLFHAFGEVSGLNPVTNSISGNVDELWAFIPGDFLKYIGYQKNTTNAHRYMTDGSPTIYFLDVPASGQTAGNGVVDGSDVVRVIIGLKKGGRSYYAFNVKNPFAPSQGTDLAWSLQPDSSGDTFINKMGLSTSTPSITRVETGISNTVKDLVFLGGGFSDDQLDAQVPGGLGYPPVGTKLGRSLLALDVVDGTIYQKYDFQALAVANTALANIGPIAYQLSPLEFFTGSGRTQRIYFSDQPTPSQARGSGIYVLGNAKKTASNIRLDSSNIDNWTSTGASGGTPGFRRVFQAQSGENVSYPPTTFLLDRPYPMRRTVAPLVSPAVVGLLFATGDRNDPLDRDAINPTTTDLQNNLYMVFDRQDSAALAGNTPLPANGASLDTLGLLDVDTYDLTTVSTLADPKIDSTNSSYYLKTKFGYSLHLGARVAKTVGNPLNGLSAYFYPKGIIQPKVLAGVLFFSVFAGTNATGTSCEGSGFTNTYRMCNVLAPVFNTGAGAASTLFDPTSLTCNGILYTMPNVPSDITPLGTTGILQTGQSPVDKPPGATTQGGQGHTDLFGFRPRTWRIIR